ncbi:TIGR00730 family Rossman fold protein [Endozoicomonas sp. OPT23]|uniref:LOG family protein n=1 Tax=Endozoicomonas sp. OPT23 TaxID=2072845 RepID=UPI00129BF680|nr:TIGR00730 family Rossman fold protein [Endozoicomonas sp. OPT23]MRI32576.1 TIGR00730 family Rossman fold protein [Endozoicomonas sp. OPT23]
MQSVCIFCGARSGSVPQYRESALTLAEELVRRDITLIYGGSSIGLMGDIASHALAEGGKVIGVIPDVLAEKNFAHPELTDTHWVKDMSARKSVMTDLSDGFIALPGGVGTLDELFEVLALNQVGSQNKPIALLNTLNYYELLLQFLNHADQ